VSYEALYRKYRPRLFSQVIGQEHITSTLKNQIMEGHVAHAYLFCGTRGTGKTTVARIFARALNCSNASDGEPCDHCDICTGDASMDIIEIDGGSNSGVSEVRDLIEKVRFAPVAGKYKVYIIDEVHTLSQNAFTALLKTLEEPPAHVVFILATTEPNKVLPTIHSRCQRFDFHRVSTSDLCSHLARIFDAEHTAYDEESLRIIAQAGQGSVRDTMSVADQCLAFCGSTVTGEKVRAVLGSVSSDFLFDTVDAMIQGDDESLLGCVDRVTIDGGDLSVFVRDLSVHFRNLMVISAGKGSRELVDCTDEEFHRYSEQAKLCSAERAIRAIDILCDAENSMRYLTRPKAKIEAALLKISRPQDEASLTALLDRISTLEKKLADREDSAAFTPQSIKKDAVKEQPCAVEYPEGLEPPPFDPDPPAYREPPAPLSRPAASAPQQVCETPAPKEANSPAAISAVVYTKMSPAVRNLVKSWQYTMNGNTIQYLVPVKFQSGMLATLKKLAPDLSAKIAAECPGITVEFIPEQDAVAAPAAKSDMRTLAEQMFGKITE